MGTRTIFSLVLAASFGLTYESGAQILRKDEPRTQIEEFTRAVDAVIVLGLTRVGQVRADLGGTVSVSAMSLTNAATGKSTSGVTVEVIEGERAGRESNSFIDFDEIGAMLEGMEDIIKATNDITAHEHFEAYYRTRGDLEIVVFDGANKAISASVASGVGAKSRVFLSIDQLVQLRAMIAEAAKIAEKNRFK